MSVIDYPSLGETWLHLVSQTIESGTPLKEEAVELLDVTVQFPATPQRDLVLEQFGDPDMIQTMSCVFFNDAENKLGHSYARLMKGPMGRNDLLDIIALLKEDSWCKRAVLTFCGEGNGKVPCINVVQFLVRNGALQARYFSRGQDAYRKFYADCLCIASMTRQVAQGVGLPLGSVRGNIASSHVYHVDMPAARQMLAYQKTLPAQQGVH
jgi:hypothetical protein